MTAVAFDPFEDGFEEDPYAQYARLRAHDPVHQTEFGPWVLSRYGDVQRFLRDTSLSVEERNAHPTAISELASTVVDGEDISMSMFQHVMFNTDPPEHTRLKRLASKAFTPRSVERLEPDIESLVDRALDAIADPTSFELIEDLAFPLPFQVISQMLGVPSDGDSKQLREWSGMIVKLLEPAPDAATLMAIRDAVHGMRAYLGQLIEWKRRNLGDDLLSGLISAEENGDVLSQDELVEQVTMLYIAGHETTVNLIGNGTLALLRHRDELARLTADPALLPGSVDEMLRYDSPVQMSRRITLRSVEVDGREMEEGAMVYLLLGSANRDALQWGLNADALDVGRVDAGDHLSFGGGHHYCLGAVLARLEATVALRSLLARSPGLELAGEPTWNGGMNLRGLSRLPVAGGG